MLATSAEHYDEAERLLAQAAALSWDDTTREQLLLASAQVHATLALAGRS